MLRALLVILLMPAMMLTTPACFSQEKTIEEQSRRYAAELTDRLFLLVSEGTDKDHLAKAMNHIRINETSVKTFLIFGADGTIVHSIHPDDIGKKIQDVAKAHQDATRDFSLVKPVFNRDECKSCHDPGKRILGLIVITVPLDAFSKQE